MTSPQRTATRPGFPASPCIDICTLDASDRCLGCGRHIDQIVRWATMSAEEQWAIVESLEGRVPAQS